MRILARLIILAIVGSSLGCSSLGHKLKNFLDGNDSSSNASSQAAATSSTPGSAKYSDNPDQPPNVRRQYKRTTKETLEDESGLDQKAGSLWVMEGQGAYLFAQNVMRLVGDPIGVVIEGEPKEQLQAKSDVIKELMAKIEERQKAHERQLAGESTDEKPKEAKEAKPEEGKETPKKTADAKPEIPGGFNVKIVPTRIVERTVDGNYRVKGSQPFMIGTKEFKVIVTGVVRAEDFSDEGISAAKLLEPKFDIVSTKRAGAEI